MQRLKILSSANASRRKFFFSFCLHATVVYCIEHSIASDLYNFIASDKLAPQTILLQSDSTQWIYRWRNSTFSRHITLSQETASPPPPPLSSSPMPPLSHCMCECYICIHAWKCKNNAVLSPPRLQWIIVVNCKSIFFFWNSSEIQPITCFYHFRFLTLFRNPINCLMHFLLNNFNLRNCIITNFNNASQMNWKRHIKSKQTENQLENYK